MRAEYLAAQEKIEASETTVPRAGREHLADGVDRERPTARIIWCNQRLTDYTGLDVDGLASADRTNLHAPKTLTVCSPAIASASRNGEEWEDIYPLRGVDGNFRWFLGRAKPIRDRTRQDHPMVRHPPTSTTSASRPTRSS